MISFVVLHHDQSNIPQSHDQNLLKTSSSDVVLVLKCLSNLDFLVAGSLADVGAGEDAVKPPVTS
jgi:hypothetical protein